eukprot:CAMPEP_0176468950 /NCGR_PEP_ID=MMETSP0127-20121128/39445_1 /TAXON_ID=938130 /ORGANISM="Platyophrya macrostoma, Strain WH" /LENGTH=219 /DNA_ID=CAMNT_0017862711 /DNA_START=32 /DNA_END=688 /DNA_ORIENTATION=-
MINHPAYHLHALQNMMYFQQREQTQTQLLTHSQMMSTRPVVSASRVYNSYVPNVSSLSYENANTLPYYTKEDGLSLSVANSLMANRLKNLMLTQYNDIASSASTVSTPVSSQNHSLLFPSLNLSKTKENEVSDKKKEYLEEPQRLLSASKKISKEPVETKETTTTEVEDEKILALLLPKKQRRLATQISRPFKCPISGCGKAYGHEASLKVHFKTKHAW